MSSKINQWGKQRLKGALGILLLLEKKMEPTLNEIKSSKKENPEFKFMDNEIKDFKKKILEKLQTIEADITEDLIRESL